MNNAPILVFGATGAQGGATARLLRARGLSVRGLTRRPESPAAERLRAAGVEMVKGDLDDVASLRAAMTGCSGVFSVQNWWERKNDEVAQGKRVLDRRPDRTPGRWRPCCPACCRSERARSFPQGALSGVATTTPS